MYEEEVVRHGKAVSAAESDRNQIKILSAENEQFKVYSYFFFLFNLVGLWNVDKVKYISKFHNTLIYYSYGNEFVSKK